ncbi:MAG: hypothetical protein U0Q18_06230 [Bryobacteraceae bacterium]
MRTVWVAVLAAGLAGNTFAETNEQRGKRVVDEALSALGGDHYLAMRDRVEAGRAYSFYNENLTGLALAKIYTRYLAGPDTPGLLSVRERQAFGKKGEDVILFTQGTGYEITFRGARPLPQARIQLFNVSRMHDVFYIIHERLKEPGMVFESRGSDFYDNRPVEIVDISDSSNETVTVYFDQLSKLPTRQSYVRRDPIDKQRIEEVSIFAKYRDLGGGVMWPYSIRRERNGEKIFEIFSESVEINQDLKDNLFTLPADMKILKKEK